MWALECCPPLHEARMTTMPFASTRGAAPSVGFTDAVVNGIAPDGGLYLPTAWPRADLSRFGDTHDLAGIAARFIAPFVAGDRLEAQLPAITADAFNFPAPLVSLRADERVSVL